MPVYGTHFTQNAFSISTVACVNLAFCYFIALNHAGSSSPLISLQTLFVLVLAFLASFL